MSGSTVRLQAMRWWHLPQVLALENELFGDERWSEEVFWSELALCPPALLGGPPRRYWVAVDSVDADVVLGYAGLAVTQDEAYVQTIAVAGQAQRRGFGSALLTRLLDEARSFGAVTCWLEVRADNPGAQAMYGRFGFVARGLRRGYYQPSNTDAVVMSVALMHPASVLPSRASSGASPRERP